MIGEVRTTSDSEETELKSQVFNVGGGEFVVSGNGVSTLGGELPSFKETFFYKKTKNKTKKVDSELFPLTTLHHFTRERSTMVADNRTEEFKTTIHSRRKTHSQIQSLPKRKAPPGSDTWTKEAQLVVSKLAPISCLLFIH
jgi:hypothetical protein